MQETKEKVKQPKEIKDSKFFKLYNVKDPDTLALEIPVQDIWKAAGLTLQSTHEQWKVMESQTKNLLGGEMLINKKNFPTLKASVKQLITWMRPNTDSEEKARGIQMKSKKAGIDIQGVRDKIYDYVENIVFRVAVVEDAVANELVKQHEDPNNHSAFTRQTFSNSQNPVQQGDITDKQLTIEDGIKEAEKSSTDIKSNWRSLWCSDGHRLDSYTTHVKTLGKADGVKVEQGIVGNPVSKIGVDNGLGLSGLSNSPIVEVNKPVYFEGLITTANDKLQQLNTLNTKLKQEIINNENSIKKVRHEIRLLQELLALESGNYEYKTTNELMSEIISQSQVKKQTEKPTEFINFLKDTWNAYDKIKENATTTQDLSTKIEEDESLSDSSDFTTQTRNAIVNAIKTKVAQFFDPKGITEDGYLKPETSTSEDIAIHQLAYSVVWDKVYYEYDKQYINVIMKFAHKENIDIKLTKQHSTAFKELFAALKKANKVKSKFDLIDLLHTDRAQIKMFEDLALNVIQSIDMQLLVDDLKKGN